MVALAETAFHAPAHAVLVNVPRIISKIGLEVCAGKASPRPSRARADFDLEVDLAARHSQKWCSHSDELTADDQLGGAPTRA